MYYKKTWKNKKRISKCKKCYKNFDTSEILIPNNGEYRPYICESCHKVYWESITNMIEVTL